jgi:hypothetical protein
MKNKDFIIMTIGSLLLLGFVVFMLLYSFKNSKTSLIRDDLINDSIILKENTELKRNDSVIMENKKKLNNLIDNHENRLIRLENRKPIINRDTVFLLKEN